MPSVRPMVFLNVSWQKRLRLKELVFQSHSILAVSWIAQTSPFPLLSHTCFCIPYWFTTSPLLGHHSVTELSLISQVLKSLQMWWLHRIHLDSDLHLLEAHPSISLLPLCVSLPLATHVPRSKRSNPSLHMTASLTCGVLEAGFSLKPPPSVDIVLSAGILSFLFIHIPFLSPSSYRSFSL